MTFQTPSGFTQIDTDSGTATITNTKPNLEIVGVGGTTTSATGNIITVNSSGSEVQEFQNLGFDSTAGRFQITQADGTELSAGSPGFVRVQDKSSFGLNQVVSLTKPYKFDDDSHASIHDIRGWHPFWNSGDNWNADRPYFVYVIQHDNPANDPAVAISQNPAAKVSPSSTQINVSGTINSNTQESFFLLEISDGSGGWTTPTIGDYDENPCTNIGSLRMQVTNTGDNDQSVSALDGFDGVGNYNEEREFICPTPVMGSYNEFFAIHPGTGGQITFNNGEARYKIQKDGMVDFRSEWNQALTTNSSTSTLIMLLPYFIRSLSGDLPLGSAHAGAGGGRFIFSGEPSNGQRGFNGGLYFHSSSNFLQHSTITSSPAYFIGFRYRLGAFKV